MKNTLTVGQLKAELENFDDDMPVLFTYAYSDHWHTQVADRFTEISEAQVIHSDYHNKYKVVDDEEGETVCLIGG